MRILLLFVAFLIVVEGRQVWEVMKEEAQAYLKEEFKKYTPEEIDKFTFLLLCRSQTPEGDPYYLPVEDFINLTAEELRKDPKGLIWLSLQVLGGRMDTLKIFELATGKDCQDDHIACVHQWIGEYEEKKLELAKSIPKDEL